MHTHAASRGWAFEVSAAGRRVRGVRLLVGLLLFSGLGATGGGISLVLWDIGLPLRLLDGSPFSDYTIPGWILTLVVGGSSLGATWLLWRRSGWAGMGAIVAGGALLGWIVTEFVMIPEAWAPQLLYFVIAMAILWLGWRTHQEVDAIR